MKFLVPALPGGYVPRPRLHAALAAAAQLPLTVVAGGPGAGKSAMLQSWQRDRPGVGAGLALIRRPGCRSRGVLQA